MKTKDWRKEANSSMKIFIEVEVDEISEHSMQDFLLKR